MYYVIFHTWRTENYYTKTAVYLLRLTKGHSQCTLGSYKSNPIVDFIIMSENTIARFKLYVYITYILPLRKILDLSFGIDFVGFVFDQVFSRRKLVRYLLHNFDICS